MRLPLPGSGHPKLPAERLRQDALAGTDEAARMRSDTTKEAQMSIVTILVIIVLVLLALYLFRRVF